MKKLLLLVFVFLFLNLNCDNPSESGERIGAVCNDGTTSTATGSGACSHHAGVDHWIYR